jgi:hypothetical protein
MVGAVDDSGPKITSDPAAKSAAPLAKLTPRNVRRVILGLSFGSERCSMLTSAYVHGNRY